MTNENKPRTTSLRKMIEGAAAIADQADDVTRTVIAIDEQMSRMAAQAGVTITDYELNGYEIGKEWDGESMTGLLKAAVIVSWSTIERDFVSLMKHGGQWGLYYHRKASMFTPPMVPLRSAPLEVREKFLIVAPAFAERFKTRVRSHSETKRKAVSAGNKALETLRGL